MNLFENLQKLNENSKSLDEIAKEIENKFDKKFKEKFGINELYTDVLFSATKNISDEYFFRGYDIVLTIQCVHKNVYDIFKIKEFVKSFANEFGYDIINVSSSLIEVLIKVDKI